MRPLAVALGRALRALRLDRDLAQATAVRRWPQAATRIIGADAVRTRAIRVERGTLVVAVPTAQWAAEIRLREGELLAAIGALAPGSGVARVRAVPDPAPQRSGPTPQ